ncbi:MAG: GGDEF domain-containing protein [Actinobacteria bacterium]|nr:GGDEF domain-containing protein [Actinomycetota bacterium]
MLTEVARRLDASVRAPDTTARFGGDEFAILLDGIDGKQGAIRIAERILAALSVPAELGAAAVPLQTSVGIALHSPGDGDAGAAALLHAADVAMYDAKRSRSRFAMFDRDLAGRVE